MTNNNNNIRETIKNEITNFVNNDLRTMEEIVFTSGAMVRIVKENNKTSVLALTSVDGGQLWGCNQHCLKTAEEVTDAVMNIYENKNSYLPMLVDHKVRRGEHAIEYVTKAICEARSEKENELQRIYVVPELGITIIVNCNKDESFIDVMDVDFLKGSPCVYAFDVNDTDWDGLYNWIESWFSNKNDNLNDLQRKVINYFEKADNGSEVDLVQDKLQVKITLFKREDGVCGIIVDSMIPAVDTFKLNDVDIDDVRYFVTDHNGIVDFDWLNNAIGITVEANERFLAR